MRPGELRLPWLNDGRATIVPDLTLGNQLDLMQFEVAVLARIGMRDDLPQWHQKKLGEVASTAYVAEYLSKRFAKADASLTRERFDATVKNRALLLELSAILANADREVWPDFRRAALGRTVGGGIGGWLRSKLPWLAWRR